jgi:hypothetical protein
MRLLCYHCLTLRRQMPLLLSRSSQNRSLPMSSNIPLQKRRASQRLHLLPTVHGLGSHSSVCTCFSAASQLPAFAPASTPVTSYPWPTHDTGVTSQTNAATVSGSPPGLAMHPPRAIAAVRHPTANTPVTPYSSEISMIASLVNVHKCIFPLTERFFSE